MSLISKLLEHVVSNQIQLFIDANSLLPLYQSAYRREFSTETALTKVYSDLISALDSEADNHAVLAFFDMTAAF